MPYSSQYPSGWRNLPDTSTPIMAAALDGFDQGIADAQSAAAAAQTTATNALSAGGDGIFVVAGVALDGVTDDGPAIQAALDSVEKGGRGAHLLIHGDSDKVCYINSTVTISYSGTVLEADVPLLLGADARIRPWGVIDETPTANPDKPALTADAASGATVLHVDQIPAGWAAGDYVGLRGKRTASGSVPNAEIFHSYVAAVDVPGLTITLVDPLPKAFLAVNNTSFSNKKSQVTKVTSTRLTGTPDAGDVTITCGDSSLFQVGDIVQILDNVHTLDDGGDVQDGNDAHKECAIVAEIPTGTSLKLSHALYHSYVLGEDARVQKLLALQDVELRGLRIGFAAQQATGQHAIEVRYAYNTHLRGVNITGGGDAGHSWSGHAIRFTDSLACSASTGTVANPADVTAGRGYGLSFYGSTLCWVSDMHVTGCRHSVLWFNGASGCEARHCLSTDARISDYDWHGAACSGNRTTGCTAVGGTRGTADSTYRTAWKWGNPSHRPGDVGNVALGCLVVNYAGVAVEGIPTSGEDVWQGVVRGAQVGVKLGPLAQDDDLLVSGFVIRDSVFYDVPQPFDVNGGAGAVVAGLVVENTRWYRSGAFEVANAPGLRFARNTISAPAMAGGYAFKATNCPGLQLKGNDFSGAPKGVYLAGCTDARVVGNYLHDLGATTVLEDHGGNTGLLWRGNDFHPGTPARLDTGTGPSSGTTVTL